MGQPRSTKKSCRALRKCRKKNVHRPRESLATVRKLGAEYLKTTYPGNVEPPEEETLHENIKWVLHGRPLDTESLMDVLTQSKNWLEQQAMADMYLRVHGSSATHRRDKACRDFDTRPFMKNYPAAYDAFHDIREMTYARPVLFPYPDDGAHGRPFFKGRDYSIAGFHLFKLPLKEVEQNLDVPAADLDRELDLDVEYYKVVHAVFAKRQEFYHAWDIDIFHQESSPATWGEWFLRLCSRLAVVVTMPEVPWTSLDEKSGGF
ncbi:MAG: hypothetical protein Q9210_006140 [Variospora velana]